jgi:peptidoglycan hydrolase CwlO-like protein
MANGIFGQKNFLPPSGEGLPVDVRLGQLEDFIYKLHESLEHTLRNLDPKSNFNSSQTEGWSAEVLTPVYDRINSTATDLRQRVAAVVSDVSALDGRVSTVEGDVGSLDGRVSASESDIASLGGRVTAVEGDVLSLDGRLSTVEGDVSALDGRVSALETTVGDHTSEIATLDGKVDGLDTGFETRVEAVLSSHGLI